MSDAEDPYILPGTRCLRNKLGVADLELLDYLEREHVLQRITEGVPNGRFDLRHLEAIHRHLFQDVYEWAGKIRTVEIAKSGNHFLFRNRIAMGMGDVHRRLKQQNFLRGVNPQTFAAAAGHVIGDVNYVHPFREGNGRTQLLYLEQLAAQASHPLDLTRLDPERWIAASRAAHDGEYGSMGEAIAGCFATPDREG